MLKKTIVLIALAVSLAGCQSTGQPEPVPQIGPVNASEGSLASEELIARATNALISLPLGLGVTDETPILKTVLQQPVGEPGAKTWQEQWIAETEGASQHFIFTFRETGPDSAEFTIEPLKRAE